MRDNEIVITTNFSQEPEDIFGKIIVAPTIKAQKIWEQWIKNPTAFTFAPGYMTDNDGKQILVEVSIIPKVAGKK